MSVKEVLRALGSWDLKLTPGVPRDVLDAIGYFGHVAIVPGRLNPAQYGDQLLTAARYVGVVRTKTVGDDGRTNEAMDDISVGGPGMAMWLGDEDDKGSVIENSTQFASASFANAVRGLLPSSGAVTEGTLYSVAGTYTGTHRWETPRTAIGYVCTTMSTTSVPVTWRVNGNGTLDAGPESSLYVTSPQCVIVTRGAGEDMAMRALLGSLDVDQDVEDYTTRVVLLAEGEGSSIATGSADISPATSYKDIHGNLVKLTRMVSESDTATANATVRAQLALSQFTSPRNAVTLSTADYDVHGTFAVGDYVWVYDPDAGLVDTANEIVFRGQRLNPIKLQVTETQWSITSGYTVAYRAADGTWYDLTDYIEWETDTTVSVTVGGVDRALTDAGTEPVGSRPNADTSVPGVPVFVTPFAGMAYLDNRGFTRSRVVIQWNAPNNVDGSSILDGDHYEIRWAVDTDMIYPATWSQVSQIRWADMQIWAQPFAAPTGKWQTMVVGWDQTTAQLQDLSPGIGYDLQIRAVDKTGNTGAWSGTTTFVASSDNIAPSTPAAPSVAASRIAVQVTHQLGKSTGGTFNLESDLHHLEIHVDYEPGFTPSASTLKAKVSATAGMMQAQIPVVATVQIEETSTRYVRVVAVDQTGNKSSPSDAASSTALLIDDAHISDLTVSKVTAGTISADWIVGARIKTADTGARAELNSGGIGLWNAAGTQTVFMAAATGDVTIVGQLKSGTTGKRLEINPTSTYLPEIRFYPNSGTDYGYINAVSAGTDVSIGTNSSPYDDGTGVQVYSRTWLNTAYASLEITRSDDQSRRGGYVWATASQLFAGFNRANVDGGTLYADSGQINISGKSGGNVVTQWLANDSYAQGGRFGNGSNENFFVYRSDGITKHTGKWQNGFAAVSNDGIWTSDIAFLSAGDTALTVSYGATFASTVVPMVTLRHPTLRTWQITAASTSSFTVTVGTSSGTPSISVWVYRV